MFDFFRTMSDICAKMGVGSNTVREWVRLGAPILVKGKGKRKRYSASSEKLQEWLEKQSLDSS